jgi:hypothetical protein
MTVKSAALVIAGIFTDWAPREMVDARRKPASHPENTQSACQRVMVVQTPFRRARVARW